LLNLPDMDFYYIYIYIYIYITTDNSLIKLSMNR
jgi:hypothetical protein